MRGYKIFLLLAAIFLVTSGVLYFTHYLIFGDPHHIFLYLLGDLAFLPLEVFLVVIVIERILTRREKQTMLYQHGHRGFFQRNRQLASG